MDKIKITGTYRISQTIDVDDTFEMDLESYLKDMEFEDEDFLMDFIYDLLFLHDDSPTIIPEEHSEIMEEYSNDLYIENLDELIEKYKYLIK